MIKRIINSLINKVASTVTARLQESQDKQTIMMGKLLVSSTNYDNIAFNQAEFSVFSQWGDDGFIQYIVNRIPHIHKTFVEFGVENYLESNTRFLLINNNWKGLVMDGDSNNISFVKNDPIYWKYNLSAQTAFVTAENINELLLGNGFSGEIGLLHVDVDGVDYWIWKAIDVIDPQVVIMEYNGLFGIERSITVPYKENFIRQQEHYSHLYAGASLPALIDLAKRKGYFFIGSNNAGNNAYFVRNNLNQFFSEVSVEQGFRISQFRESRDEMGNLTFESRSKSIERLRGQIVYNTITKENEEF